VWMRLNNKYYCFKNNNNIFGIKSCIELNVIQKPK
jgi:hypothetical protein